MLERLTSDKHSSLLRKTINYDRKSVIVQALEANVKKIMPVIYEFSYTDRVFVRIGLKTLLGKNTLAYYKNL